MQPLSPNPVLYEINTFVWLGELSRKYQRPVVLGQVPDEEWAYLADLGVELVWLMGVWERSPMGLTLVRNNPVAIREFKQMLPDYHTEDLAGSPYSVRRYSVDSRIGGDTGLAQERAKLAGHGIRLILDYVPNHVAPDHPWTRDHPEYFVQGTPRDLEIDPESYIKIGPNVIARGRDPNFPAWMDVVQLNAFHPGLRQATQDTIFSIAQKCDGMRVDMAMLLLNRIFALTWGPPAGPVPEDEYWPGILQSVKTACPGTLFIAETYWDTERELLDQGFDYCYDKPTYDHLKEHDAGELAEHLYQTAAYQNKLVHFIENHDEQRAATAFPGGYWRAAALASATLPGMRMLHQGQFDGRQTRVSVLLRRHPDEESDAIVTRFYEQLVRIITRPPIQNGKWSPCPLLDEHGNTLPHCLAWMWTDATSRRVVITNLSHRTMTGWLEVSPAEGVTHASLQEVWEGEETHPVIITEHAARCLLTLAPFGGRIFDLRFE